jgi:type VI secretion system protein ImpK
MTEPFATIVGPFLRAVVELREGFERGEHPDLHAVRERLLGLLAEAEERASRSSQLAHDFALAKHALVYWADEVLIDSHWRHALEWREYILEESFYKTRLRASRFYERAAEAEGLSGTDPLEVYYLAVALGFRGDHALDEAGLQRWAKRVHDRIAGSNPHPAQFLPREERGDLRPLAPLPGKSLLLAVSVLVSVTALVTLTCFLLAIHLRA